MLKITKKLKNFFHSHILCKKIPKANDRTHEEFLDDFFSSAEHSYIFFLFSNKKFDELKSYINNPKSRHIDEAKKLLDEGFPSINIFSEGK